MVELVQVRGGRTRAAGALVWVHGAGARAAAQPLRDDLPACLPARPQGLSRADQAEVDINRVAVYLNIAAAHMALKVGGQGALDHC